jgi:hypothetical protein
MKRYLSIIIGIVALITTSVQANLLTIAQAPHHSPNGGKFLITLMDNPTPSFYTFCIERNQHIINGNTYSYQVSNMTDGGVHGAAPVSIGTAWLYYNFYNNTLAGFTDTTKQQTDLQNAFWYLQGELPTIKSNPWIALAQQSLGANVDLYANGNGAYGVSVWNLFDMRGNAAQSQLAISRCSIPVPEQGTFLVSIMGLFLPFALLRVKSFSPSA